MVSGPKGYTGYIFLSEISENFYVTYSKIWNVGSFSFWDMIWFVDRNIKINTWEIPWIHGVIPEGIFGEIPTIIYERIPWKKTQFTKKNSRGIFKTIHE